MANWFGMVNQSQQERLLGQQQQAMMNQYQPSSTSSNIFYPINSFSYPAEPTKAKKKKLTNEEWLDRRVDEMRVRL